MTRRTLILSFCAALLVAFATPALAADAPYREFTGRIDIIKKKKFIVDNRQGDKVSFVLIKTTEVSGEKKSVKKLRKNDWVTVSWKFVDKPRKAYKIVVLPPRED
ncbi:MAG: hypothetical protein QF570_18575 [Myxococcota bacterium]|jgi:hypothetical protein|nr:hypothetical protein [Myxococcota bacterium]